MKKNLSLLVCLYYLTCTLLFTIMSTTAAAVEVGQGVIVDEPEEEQQNWEFMKVQLTLDLNQISLPMDNTEAEIQVLEDTASKFIHELLTRNNILVRDGLTVEVLSHDVDAATADLCVTGMVQNPQRMSLSTLIYREFDSGRFENELNGDLSRVSDAEENAGYDSGDGSTLVDNVDIFVGSAIILAVVNVSALLFIFAKRNRGDSAQQDDDVGRSANLANHDDVDDNGEDLCVFDDDSTISPLDDSFYRCGGEGKRSITTTDVNCVDLSYGMPQLADHDAMLRHVDNGIQVPLQHLYCRTISSGASTDQISRKLARCMPPFEDLIIDCDAVVDSDEESGALHRASQDLMKECARTNVGADATCVHADDLSFSSSSNSSLSLPYSPGSQGGEFGGMLNCGGMQCQYSFASGDIDFEDTLSFTLVLNQADQDSDVSSLSTVSISESDKCIHGGRTIQSSLFSKKFPFVKLTA